MAKTGFLVCLLIVVAMDVVAGILGIQAEIAKNKQVIGDAFKLGLAAAVLLALSQITSNLLGGCMCISSMEELEFLSSANRKIWFSCFIFSWIIVAVGFVMLIIGALENSKSRGPRKILHNRPISGILCFVHGLLCILSYVSATVNFRNESPTQHEAHP